MGEFKLIMEDVNELPEDIWLDMMFCNREAKYEVEIDHDLITFVNVKKIYKYGDETLYQTGDGTIIFGTMMKVSVPEIIEIADYFNLGDNCTVGIFKYDVETYFLSLNKE